MNQNFFHTFACNLSVRQNQVVGCHYLKGNSIRPVPFQCFEESENISKQHESFSCVGFLLAAEGTHFLYISNSRFCMCSAQAGGLFSHNILSS